MSESVGSHEIIFGFAGCHVTDDGLSSSSLSGNAKNTGSMLALLQRTCFILSSSFVSAGKLMAFFDSTLHIVFHPCRHYENRTVRTTVHGLRIDVVVLLVILLEPSPAPGIC